MLESANYKSRTSKLKPLVFDSQSFVGPKIAAFHVNTLQQVELLLRIKNYRFSLAHSATPSRR